MSEQHPDQSPPPQETAAPAQAAPAADAPDFIIDETNDQVLRLQLDKFEGPFEVLLYLIKSQEIDIFDIPILKVTEQYLRFLEILREENLDMAGEFLVMAATLIQIKSRMLIPVEVEEEDEEIEEEDPRLELVEKLLEYRKFRDLAQALTEREEECQNWIGRRVKHKFDDAPEEEEYFEVSLYDLIKALRSILRFVSEDYVHEVHGEGASVEEKIAEIEALLEEQGSVAWTDLLRKNQRKVDVVCCLLAILELCRMRRIRAHQHRVYGDIRLVVRAHEDEPQQDLAVS